MKHLKPKITSRINTSGSKSFCVDAGIVNNKRQRRFFPSKEAALQYAEKLQKARVKDGESVFSLTSKQQWEAVRCFEKLKEFDTCLSDAVDFYCRHNKPKNGKKLVFEVAAEFLESRIQANAKPRYLKALRVAFGKFSSDFGTRCIHEISKAEIEEWLNTRTVSVKNLEKWSPVTKRNYLRDIGMLFKHAVDEGYCAENSVTRIKKPRLLDKAVEIFSIGDVIRILSGAHSMEKSLVPYLAIGFFAGLRSSEIETLDWTEIDLHNRRIEVTAEKAKTSRRRFVTISDNLHAWLKPYEKMEGCIVTLGWRDRLQKLTKLAEFEKLPRNGLRHSFGSYHLAYHRNSNATAMEMGHETTKMLFAHYRELVTADDAARFWNIMPPEKGWLMRDPAPKKVTRSNDKLLEKIAQVLETSRIQN